MVRGSMVPREISLEEKRVYAPTLMIQELFFLIFVAAALTVQDTVVRTPVVSSPVATTNKKPGICPSGADRKLLSHIRKSCNSPYERCAKY